MVDDMRGLDTDEVIESGIFEIGGFKWKLALFRGFWNNCPPELIRIFLFSCNAQAVHSDVYLQIVDETQERNSLVARKPKVAGPFQIMDKLQVPYKTVINSCQGTSASMVIAVDLKNIREATEAEQRKSMINGRTVHLEVIDKESIRICLNQKQVFAIPPNRKRYADLRSHSLIRPWAESSPDKRYWLCERSENGMMEVKRCLNDAWILDCFENICDQSGGGFPWITVFREEKKSNTDFPSIDDNSILIFCLLCEEPYEDLVYLGYAFVPKTLPCQQLLMKLTDDFAHVHEHEELLMYLQTKQACTDITDWQSSLNECHVCSGSVVILKPKPPKLLANGFIPKRGESGDETEEVIGQETSNCMPTKEENIDGYKADEMQPCDDGGIGNPIEKTAGDSSEKVAKVDESRSEAGNDVALKQTDSDKWNNSSEAPDVLSNSEQAKQAAPRLENAQLQSDGMSGEDTMPVAKSASIANAESSHSLFQAQHAVQEQESRCEVQDSQNSIFLDDPNKQCSKSSQVDASNSARSGQTTSTQQTDQFMESLDVCFGDNSSRVGKEVKIAIGEIGTEIVSTLRRDVTEPILKELRQVSGEVNEVRKVVDATCHEVCKANMLANINVEELSCNGVTLHLRDRDAHKVYMITDDFVKDHPIFLLNRNHQHRLRVSLAHKHQGDATNFKIKHISVKPSDGIELGLTISEAKPPSEGSEVVALLPLDFFQSSKISSGCPQFGPVEERYVSLAITIGVEVAFHGSQRNTNSLLELKGQILCLPVTRPDIAGFKCFQRFASQSWRNSPQWIRDGARGAVILTSTAVVKSGQTSPLSPLACLGSFITSILILPCFRLDQRC